MWQERFEEMQVKVDAFLIGYKSDFEIDKKAIAEAPQDTFFVDAAQNRHAAC